MFKDFNVVFVAFMLMSAPACDDVQQPQHAFHQLGGESTNIGGGGSETLHVIHDDRRDVTCWVISDSSGISISCLPDRWALAPE